MHGGFLQLQIIHPSVEITLFSLENNHVGTYVSFIPEWVWNCDHNLHAWSKQPSPILDQPNGTSAALVACCTLVGNQMATETQEQNYRCNRNSKLGSLSLGIRPVLMWENAVRPCCTTPGGG